MKDGGPAFPRPAAEGHNWGRGPALRGYGEQSGMSLRDWFAGQALNAVLSRDAAVLQQALEQRQGVASVAYQFADAMLAERVKGE